MRTTLLAAFAAVMAGSLFSAGAAENPGSLVVSVNLGSVKAINLQNFQKNFSASFQGADVRFMERVVIPEKQNEFMIVLLENFKSFPRGYASCATAAAVACASFAYEHISIRHRVFVSKERALDVLKAQTGFAVTSGPALDTVAAQAAAHEIIHLLLGRSEQHETSGLFAAQYKYLPGQGVSPTLAKKVLAAVVASAPAVLAAAPPPMRAVGDVLPYKEGPPAANLVALANEE